VNLAATAQQAQEWLAVWTLFNYSAMKRRFCTILISAIAAVAAKLTAAFFLVTTDPRI
jgi:hypothetical protein